MASAIQCIPTAVSAQLYRFGFLDSNTREHGNRVARCSVAIGKHMALGAGDLDQLHTAALWHDIGKIAIEARVLEKPGRLTQDEFELIKRHPIDGARLVRSFSRHILAGIELHHERLDGSGYPYGLAGDRIPMTARIIAVADTYDAITSHRPYQTAMSRGFAVQRIRSLAVSKLDPRVVAALEIAVEFGCLFTEQNIAPN
jgi:HD-GYP domain-containing protein (c-di-GMP phosphodiesterase class II)